ncbi:MAG: hypothetical protein MZV65_12460 [Chromatiales bacterium]|nr:hypothetical protein [Chromatiales bacterium]
MDLVNLKKNKLGNFPARALGRGEAPRRHRAGAGGAADADHRRRADQRARCLDPGAGDQPAARPAGAVRPVVPVHLARPAPWWSW